MWSFKRKMQYIFFEWVVIDNCNLNCEYCVSKGSNSQKTKSEMVYVSGREVDIARKVSEISRHFREITVNLTGGEPLLATGIRDVLKTLTGIKNCKTKLITNFKLIEKVDEYVYGLHRISISLHMKYRKNDEIENIVRLVNQYKKCKGLNIGLSQVDYEITPDIKEKLDYISRATELPVSYQPFIPLHWMDRTKTNAGEKDRAMKQFIRTAGKRCALGTMFKSLRPDGTFFYGLYCQPHLKKIGNFLAPFSEIKDLFLFDKFEKCPFEYCGCNYNTFAYKEYLETCNLFKYKKDEVMPASNLLKVN